MTVDDHQYAYRGVVFGGGTAYDLVEVEGLEGFETRVGDRDLPRGHGAIPGRHYASARLVRFVLRLFDPSTGNDEAVVEQLRADLHRAFRIRSEAVDDELVFQRPGQPERMVRCRPISVPATLNKPGRWVRELQVAFRAADPRIYSAAVHQAVVPLYTPGGGADWPADITKDTTAGTAVEAVATNAGDADAYPLIRFYGPAAGTVTAVKLTNRTTGQALEIVTPVAAGQILQADMDAAATSVDRQIIGIDGSTRYAAWALPRTPFALVPGDNVLRFEITGTSTTVRCLVDWRDTWLG